MARITLADTVLRIRPLAPLRAFVPDPNRPDVWWNSDAKVTDYGQREFTADDFTESITEWVLLTEPPIWHGHSPSVVLGEPEIETGRVVGVLRLSEEEASELGIDSQSGDWLYAECACLPALASLIDSGEIRGTSPRLATAYLDDAGKVWPVILRELSFVREPRLRTQPKATEIDSANLGDPMIGPKFATRLRKARSIRVSKRDGTVLFEGPPLECRMSDLPKGESVTIMEDDETIATTTSEEMETAMSAKLEDEGHTLVDMLTAALETLEGDIKDKARELLDMLTAAAAAGEMAEEADAAMSDRVSNSANIKTLLKRIKRLESEREVDKDLSNKVLPVGVSREKLLECRMRDTEAYSIALSAFATKPRLDVNRVNLSDQRPAGVVGEVASRADMAIAAANAKARGESFDPIHFARNYAGAAR